ncbi:MAG: hypothetical protein AMXMBFR58_01450 [Phycisphaerae bacterium]|nr:hypothetical protein [Phycisphaerales bacterium]
MLQSRIHRSCLVVITLCGGVHGLAPADMIRPNSATATSTYSGSYSVNNTINGSGLPANFGPGDAHANYAGGNHWTTANGRTIGESATYFFNTPQTIGGFYMWAHRSNNIAHNPHYAATLFDLVLRDSAGQVLAEHKNLVGIPGIAVAQPYAFDVTANVSSVQFIVRATANGNVSPYTGLAEVAFETCFPATSAAPNSTAVCPTGTAVFQAIAGGSGPLTYSWETLDENGNWVAATDGAFIVGGEAVATISGSQAGTVEVTLAPELGDSPALRQWRCKVTNSCGEETSDPADMLVCAADFDCSGFTDIDDFTTFVLAFEEGTDDADYDGSGFVDFEDYIAFVLDFEAGC